VNRRAALFEKSPGVVLTTGDILIMRGGQDKKSHWIRERSNSLALVVVPPFVCFSPPGVPADIFPRGFLSRRARRTDVQVDASPGASGTLCRAGITSVSATKSKSLGETGSWTVLVTEVALTMSLAPK